MKKTLLFIRGVISIGVVATALIFALATARTEIPITLPRALVLPIYCWDTNMDGLCTLPNEDKNGDNKCDLNDCDHARDDPRYSRAGLFMHCTSDAECTTNDACATGICSSGICNYYIRGGSCATDKHCASWQKCSECVCVDHLIR